MEFEGAQLHTKASEAFDALRRYADSLYFSGFRPAQSVVAKNCLKDKKMTSQSPPAELLAAREQIDVIDRELVGLLGKRFEFTHQVGLLKASQALEPVDAPREAEKLAELSALCEQHNLNPALVTELFSKIMAEAVKNHRQLRE